jgi:hypothetical protein
MSPDVVKAWIARDLRNRVTFIPSDNAEDVCFRTDRYIYTVTVRDDWIGCTCRTRFNAPGKGHPLFADLPDGKPEETWQAILGEIKRMEIKPYRGRAL